VVKPLKDDLLETSAYKITLTDWSGLLRREVAVAGFSEKCAEIDAVDLYASSGFFKVKSVKKLPSAAKWLIAFPSLVAKLF